MAYLPYKKSRYPWHVVLLALPVIAILKIIIWIKQRFNQMVFKKRRKVSFQQNLALNHLPQVNVALSCRQIRINRMQCVNVLLQRSIYRDLGKK